MRAAAIITAEPGTNQFKGRETFSGSPNTGHERSQSETCGNVISCRRDDSQPDGSIHLCHNGDEDWARKVSYLRDGQPKNKIIE